MRTYSQRSLLRVLIWRHLQVWRLGLVDFAGIAKDHTVVAAVIDHFVSHLEEIFQRGRAASLAQGKLVRTEV